MVDTTAKKSANKSAAKIALRQTLSDAYTFAVSQELNYGIAAMNLESMMQQELTRLRGPMNSDIYLPVIDRLKSLKSSVTTAIAKVKELPPEDFMLNTGREGTNEEISYTDTETS